MQGEKLITSIDISHYMIDEESINLVTPGDLITQQEGYMNGHGTYKSQGNIYASLMGTVQITNRLIIVNPIKSKYSPQIGDIIVGKIIEIANKRWKVDINASSFGYLNLNAAYIPQQRKKNQEDQFNMRKIMEEGDTIVAEIQSINMDKTFNLHTRNPKYGKLEPGVLLQVPHKLVKKQKHHILAIAHKEATVGVILGNNGNIWLSGMNRIAKQTELREMERNLAIKNGQKLDAESMKTISILYNIMRILCWEGLQISQILLKDLLKFIQDNKISHEKILTSRDGDIKEYLLDSIRERIPKRLEQLCQNVTRN